MMRRGRVEMDGRKVIRCLPASLSLSLFRSFFCTFFLSFGCFFPFSSSILSCFISSFVRSFYSFSLAVINPSSCRSARKSPKTKTTAKS